MNIDALLAKARELREKGKTAEALEVFNVVLLAAQKTKKYPKIVQAFADRAIAWRHLFEKNEDVLFAILARKDAETMLELVKQFGVVERLHTAYYLLGQAALLFQEYEDAEMYFYKSLKYFKGSLAEKGSWKYHWAKALYMIGEKKKALLAFGSAIDMIKKQASHTDSFLTNVYLSGAYANLAHVMKRDDRKIAKEYYKQAEKIVKGDKRLVVRREQLKKLASYLNK